MTSCKAIEILVLVHHIKELRWTYIYRHSEGGETSEVYYTIPLTSVWLPSAFHSSLLAMYLHITKYHASNNYRTLHVLYPGKVFSHIQGDDDIVPHYGAQDWYENSLLWGCRICWVKK